MDNIEYVMKIVLNFRRFDYLPENAQIVARFDVHDLRGSDLFADIRKLAGEQSPQVPQDIDVDNVSELFVAGAGFGPDDDPLVVVRTKEDRSPMNRRQQATRSYQNVEYAVVGKSGGKDVVMAKTADRTFCLAPEDVLKRTIERLAAKRAQPAGGLQSAIDAVSGSRHYFAGINVKVNIPLAPMSFTIDRLCCRLSVASSVRFEATAVFATADQAASFKKMIDMVIGMLPAMLPPDKKKLLRSDCLRREHPAERKSTGLRCDVAEQRHPGLLKAGKEGGGIRHRGHPRCTPSRAVHPTRARHPLPAFGR